MVISLLAAVLILGGGGSPAPVPELMLELISGALFAAFLIGGAATDELPKVAPQIWLMVALVIILPLLQLIPLPPVIWQALPGREIERDLLGLIGAQNSWRPWSMTSDRTLAAMLSMAPPLAILLFVASSSRRVAETIVGTIAAWGLLSIVIGAGQTAGGPYSPLRFYGTGETYLLGFQANHNSTADGLLIGLIACAASLAIWARKGRALSTRNSVLVVFGGLVALFVIALILAGSRAGMLLAPVSVVFSVWVLLPWLRLKRQNGVMALASIVLLSTSVWLLRGNDEIKERVGRLELVEVARPEIWKDTVFAIKTHWPAGTGLGSFVPVFVAAERLEVVDTKVPNRAHNDYLEFLLEAGLSGALLLASFAAILARRTIVLVRSGQFARDPTLLVAIAILCIVALHSLVDYPMRSISLASVTAAAIGLLFRSELREETQSYGD